MWQNVRWEWVTFVVLVTNCHVIDIVIWCVTSRSIDIFWRCHIFTLYADRMLQDHGKGYVRPHGPTDHWTLISASKEASVCVRGNCHNTKSEHYAVQQSLCAQMSVHAWVWCKQIQLGMRHWQEAVVPIPDICTAWPGGWRVCSGLKTDMCNVTTHLSCSFRTLKFNHF